MQHNEHCYITNFSPDDDWNCFKREFGKFGEIRKIFVDSGGKFAKVYFLDSECAHAAAENFKKNVLGWTVVVASETNFTKQNKFNNKEAVETNSKMYDDYLDMVVQPVAVQYVNVHGHPIELLLDDDRHEAYVRLKDVEQSGFTIFKRSEFERIRRLREEERCNIIMEEFDMFMLSQAQTYLINNLVTCILKRDIMDTIESCKNELGIDYSRGRDSRSRNTRMVNQSFEDNNISVKFDNQEFKKRDSQNFRGRQTSMSNTRGEAAPSRPKSQNRNGSVASGYNSFAEPQPIMRLPKTLPNNFVPTHTQRYAGPPHNNRNQNNNNNRSVNNDRSRQQYQNNQRQSNDTEELWGSEPCAEQKPSGPRKSESRDSTGSRTNSQCDNKNNFTNKNFDTQSQSSDSSNKKKSFLKSLESIDNIGKVVLEIGKTYNVRVTHIEKENICWVQEFESSKDIDELLVALDDAVSELNPIENVARGKLAIAEYEGAWCRCRVLHLNPLNVLFIDYGNREDIELVKELPQKFRTTPALATRIVINRNTINLKNDLELKIKIINKYDDDTYLIDIEESSSQKQEKQTMPIDKEPVNNTEKETVSKPKMPEPPQQEKVAKPKTPEPPQEEKHFFKMPRPMADIQNGDKVMLIDKIGVKFAVKTKECAQKSKEILEYIKSLNKSDLMLSSVKEDQLVLCSKDGLPNLCRGVVKTKVSPSIVTVKYLDYPGEDQLSVKSLRNVDERLATEPLSLLFTPELEVISTLTEKSINFIEELLEKKEKAKVVITEDQDFDLQLDGGKFLSETLLLLEKAKNEEDNMPILVKATSTPKMTKSPEPLKRVATPKKEETTFNKKVTTPKDEAKTPKIEATITKKADVEEPITYNEMPFIKADVGSSDSYICYNVTDLTEITLVSMTDESIDLLNKVISLEVSDEEPFDPEILDMCLVFYKGQDDEGASWSRAVVLDKVSEGYELSLVDFGTKTISTSKDIRRFPSDLKDIPILGILCSLKNIPINAKTLARVKELVPENSEVTVDIKEFDEDELKYLVEFPDVYKTLKKEGLC